MQPVTAPRPSLAEALRILAGRSREAPSATQAWIVGGAIRDALLTRTAADADLVVAGDPEAFAGMAAEALGTHPVRIGREAAVWRLPLADGHIDVAPLGPTLEADLARRDFTVNTLALPLARLPAGGLAVVRREDVVDQLGGLADLDRRILRLAGPTALHDDPLRALRGVRLACELGFEIEPATHRRFGEAVPRLADVAPERIGAELERVFATPRAPSGVRLMDSVGLLDFCFPALAEGRGVTQRPLHQLDVHEHQLVAGEWLEVLLASDVSGTPAASTAPAVPEAAAVSSGLWGGREWSGTPWGAVREHLAAHAAPLRIATLLHDVGKPATRTEEPDGRTRFFGHAERGAEIAGRMLRRLRFPGATVARVELLVAQHLRPGQLAPPGEVPTARALHRFQRALGDATPDACWLFLADSLATVGAQVLLPRWPAYVSHVHRIVTWQPPAAAAAARLVDGRAVMIATGLRPGPAVGHILVAIEEAAVAGELRSREEALALAVTLASHKERGGTG